MAFSFSEKIQKISPRARGGAFVALLVLMAIGFTMQIIIPMNTQIKQLRTVLAEKQALIQKNDEQIKNLEKLRAEVKTLQQQLKELTEQLPPESEVSGLLRQIQEKVNQSGLVLKLWRPDKPRDHSSGLYREIPVTLTLNGGYHATAVFFDSVSKLSRIVNILNIKMGSAKLARDGSMQVDINCTAMTFSALEKKVEPAPTGKKVK